MSYATVIGEFLPEGYDARHVEAYMRLQYGTLDHLSRETFRSETKLATQCIDLGGADEAEQLAKSYGL